MRGYSHAITGAAAWALVATPEVRLSDFFDISGFWDIPLTTGLLEVETVTYGLGFVLSAGAVLLSDSDHHNGSIAHSLPKVGPIPSPTQALCRVIGKISGGHRHGTHSFVGIAVFTLLAFLAGLIVVPIGNHNEVAVGSGVFAFLLTAFALKVFHVGGSSSWVLRWSLSLLMAGAITWWMPQEWNVLPVIVFIGCLTHCIGDSLTVGGCPWLWPWKPKPPKAIEKTPVLRKVWQSNGWFAFPILGKTDSSGGEMSREGILASVLTLYIMASAGYFLFEHFTG